MSKGYWLATY